MKVAISTDGDVVSAHFGRCPSFTIVEIQDKQVVKTDTIANPGHHPGFLPQFLREKGVSAIIAGGMGMRAQELFVQSGIETIMGISGKINDVVAQVVSGTLKGGESLCQPGAGRGYGIDKTVCDNPEKEECDH
ncbi:MAG: NifB/NifX family molybdenum-iron cluster-binding protein [Candidatus Susulua stagnicola]|nr:NifB/NifX family molybdenum-iron cluster-binding protein [Candidatus Susulua stagnicola]